MHRFRGTRTWILLGVIAMLAIWRLSLPESPENTYVEQRTAMAIHPQGQPTSITPEAGAPVAVESTGSQAGPGEISWPAPSAQSTASGVNPPSGEPVYIGHTDRVVLQPKMVEAIRHLTDTSHDGLNVRSHASGAQIVDTPGKFRHVAVAAITPGGKITQQDFSTSP